LAGIVALGFTLLIYPNRHGAHGVGEMALIAFGAVAVLALAVAATLSIVASARLRRLLAAVLHAV
jgi:hypothetical protein